MSPNISDHVMLVLNEQDRMQKRINSFKFISCSAGLDEFSKTVSKSWNIPIIKGDVVKAI